MIKMKHYIVIRFNLGLYRTHANPDEWFAKRMRIFKSVTAPSLQRQSVQDFTCAILFDAETPRKHSNLLWDCLVENRLFGFSTMLVPITLAGDWRPKRYGERWSCEIDYSSFIDAIVNESKYIIQTRLDNDDALMPDAVEKIQFECAGHACYLVDFTRGYVIDSDNKKAYCAQHPFGTPFISLYQPASQKTKCIYSLIHQKLASVYARVERTNRIWVMNIHESNVSNRLFPWLLENEIAYDSAVSGCI